MEPSVPKSAIKHVSFVQPADETVKAWRFMTLDKFVLLLANKQLWLSRADKLGDPYEGTWPPAFAHKIFELFRARAKKETPDKSLRALTRELQRAARENTFVNCWHVSNDESAGMWDLYCGRENGIAITTTYARLRASISRNDTRLGMIRYIDYNAGSFPDANMMEAFTHKRRAFLHENEARFVAFTSKEWGMVRTESGKPSWKIPTAGPVGKPMVWNPIEWIDAVYIHPRADDLYAQSVRAVMNAYSLDKPVTHSALYRLA